MIPYKTITRDLAERHPDLERCVNTWHTCGPHTVAVCPACQTPWRYDQLVHPSIGYYPGERLTNTTQHTPDSTPRPGNRYQHRCPHCNTDLTLLTELHADACNLSRKGI